MAFDASSVPRAAASGRQATAFATVVFQQLLLASQAQSRVPPPLPPGPSAPPEQVVNDNDKSKAPKRKRENRATRVGRGAMRTIARLYDDSLGRRYRLDGSARPARMPRATTGV